VKTLSEKVHKQLHLLMFGTWQTKSLFVFALLEEWCHLNNIPQMQKVVMIP